jgi:hypothetical protein
MKLTLGKRNALSRGGAHTLSARVWDAVRTSPKYPKGDKLIREATVNKIPTRRIVQQITECL